MNFCFYTGRLTKDPELRSTQSGKHVTSFSIAVNRYPEGADFIDCVAWGKTAETIVQYMHKGSRIAVTGHTQSRSYQNRDGKTVYVTECIVDTMEFLDSKRAEESTPSATPATSETPTFVPVDSDEDLPF